VIPIYGRALLVALSSAALGCVLGSEPRPTRSQAMAGPPPDPHERPSAAGWVERSPGALPNSDGSRGKRPSKDSIWVDGFWHWNGVRYVWVDGRWERRNPPYSRGR
jgi:WXXGXW repeat (2 copies)